MITISDIKENHEAVKETLSNRNVKVDTSLILNLDSQRSELQVKIQKLQEERNILVKSSKQENWKRGKEIKDELKKLEPELEIIQKKLTELTDRLPNSLHPDSPIGTDESENKIVREVGQKKTFSFKPKDHIQIGVDLNLIDFEKGTKVAGSNFYFFKNQMVELEFAISRFAIDILKSKGFSLFITPDIAKTSIVEGIGFQPRGPETQVYTIENTNLCLIGTAEITLGGYHSGEIIEEKYLPLKYAGFSHCFRTEAGGYGRESRGLYRVHQFSKVEMFIYCIPSESDKYHEELLHIEEDIYQTLDLPYRVVDIASGDLGAPAYRKFDLEVWMPGMEKWGEVTSTSNCTDYQSKKLKIKYRKKDGMTSYVHMLNGTCVTSSRLPIAILENYQQEDGSVIIPEALHKYTGFARINAKKT